MNESSVSGKGQQLPFIRKACDIRFLFLKKKIPRNENFYIKPCANILALGENHRLRKELQFMYLFFVYLPSQGKGQFIFENVQLFRVAPFSVQPNSFFFIAFSKIVLFTLDYKPFFLFFVRVHFKEITKKHFFLKEACFSFLLLSLLFIVRSGGVKE